MWKLGTLISALILGITGKQDPHVRAWDSGWLCGTGELVPWGLCETSGGSRTVSVPVREVCVAVSNPIMHGDYACHDRFCGCVRSC